MVRKVTMKEMPGVGLIPVIDPRIDTITEKKILDKLRLDSKVRELGFEVVFSAEAVKTEDEAVNKVREMERAGVSSIIFFTTWFLRANVVVGASRSTGLPVMLWSIPDMDNTSLIGYGVAHGSLDETGISHETVCGPWDENARRKMTAWIKACHAKKKISGSRYGDIGGSCLSMLTGVSDPNQWRRKFGIGVESAEQWTLINKARLIKERDVSCYVKKWKEEFKSVDVSDDVLKKSAKLYLAGKKMFAENGWDFAGVKCQFELIDNYLAPCLPIALWNDEGYTVACETDMNAALTMYALNCLGAGPVMFSDIQYIDYGERWARFLNCGTAATLLAGGRKNVTLKDCPEVQGTYDEKKRKHLCKGGACTSFVLPPGDVTLARFGRIEGRYVLHLSKGESFEYHHDEKSLLGIGGSWPFAYVKIKESLDTFCVNLRAHHMCIAFGDWVPEMKILAKLWNVELL